MDTIPGFVCPSDALLDAVGFVTSVGDKVYTVATSVGGNAVDWATSVGENGATVL